MELTRKNAYFYSAYGLNIKSEIPLPELIPGTFSKEDISIIFRTLDKAFLEDQLAGAVTFQRPKAVVKILPTKSFYHWENIARALICEGREVIIDTEAGIEADDLAPFITGAIFAHLLNQRGLLVLHGSAVEIEGQAVSFLGDKGAGKSTLALHLQAKGYKLITDDLIPISFNGNEVYTTPGFPRIRLWSDSVSSAGLDSSVLPKINKFIDKHSYRCFNRFSPDPIKLNRIYILTEDSEISIGKLNSVEAFIELTRNTYLNRYLQATGQTEEHFRGCESIIKSVPVYRLKKIQDFGFLSELTAAIEGHR